MKRKCLSYTSIPGNRGVNGGIAFSELDPLTKNPFPQRTASICCTTLVNELPAPSSAKYDKTSYLSLGKRWRLHDYLAVQRSGSGNASP